MGKPQNRKRQRSVNTRIEGKHFYIFCEGEKTEPKYFRGFERAIESNAVYKNLVHIRVEGVGAETIRVINTAEEYVNSNQIKNAHIWCVYDKDSFPKQDFNAVSERAKVLNSQQTSVEYHVAWSNQCIEYWFLLHFAYYVSDNDRAYYRTFLHREFKKLGWSKYEKNNDELFEIMTEKGNPKQAIRWAKQRIQECSGLTDTASAPATKVHLLVEELAQYLPEDIRVKYI